MVLMESEHPDQIVLMVQTVVGLRAVFTCSNDYVNPCPAEPGHTLPLQIV